MLQQHSLNCSFDFFLPDSAMISVTKGNVLEDCFIKEHALLLNKRDIVSKPVNVEHIYRLSVYQYFSRIDAVESHQKIA